MKRRISPKTVNVRVPTKSGGVIVYRVRKATGKITDADTYGPTLRKG